MAGDWIKVEHALPDKPEVLEICRLVDRPHAEVLGALVLTWIWWDTQSRDGNACVTLPSLNRNLLRVTGIAELASALVAVGWLEDHHTHVTLVHFDYHMSESAKKRALAQKRASRFRNAEVTQPSRTRNAVSVTREEKRRDKKPPISPPMKRCPSEWQPDAAQTQRLQQDLGLSEQVVALELAKFRDYEFRTGHKDWNATWRNWLREAGARNGRHKGRGADPPFVYTRTTFGG